MRSRGFIVSAVCGVALAALTCGCRGVDDRSSKEPSKASARAPDQRPAGPAASERVLATVNGAPITELDVMYWVAKNTQGKLSEPTPEQTKNVLEAIIAQELILQKAVELGLDRSDVFQRKLRAKQVELDSFRRTELRDEYFMHLTREASKQAEQEARELFDRHADQIRTRYHLFQVLRSSRAEIDEIAAKVAAGTPFEEAAAAGMPALPDGVRKPWDVGYLSWLQVPETWREPLEQLEVGQTSGVIEGAQGRRFWLLKLVDKQTDPEVDFEGVREGLISTVARDRVERMRAETDAELRKQARIVYEDQPPAPPAGGAGKP